MCGLIGLATSVEFPGSSHRRQFMKEGLYVSAGRGEDGTGLAFVKHGEEKQLARIYKDAIAPYDFLHRPFVTRMLQDTEKFSIMMGHTRSTTRGSAIFKDTHPFQHGHITLMHNGTIDNVHEFAPNLTCPAEIVVDSHKVCWAMGELKEGEEEIKVLEKLKGGFVLMWHNARDGSLNIARNEKKPLYLAYVEKENTVVWASEYYTLMSLMYRHQMEVEDLPIYLRPNNWYKFNIKDLRDMKEGVNIRPFVLRRPDRPPIPALTYRGRMAETTTITSGSPNDTGSATGVTDATFTELPKNLVGSLNLSEENSVKDWLRANRQTFHSHGVPTSFKKVQKAARDLEDLGYQFAQATAMRPLEFRPYRAKKHQRTRTGDIIGTTMKGDRVVISSMPVSRWDDYQISGRILIRLINVRKDGDKKSPKIIVAIEHERMAERIKAAWKEVKKQGDTKEDKSSEDEVVRTVRGPRGSFIPVDQFLALTKDGCANCTGDIFIHDAEEILWLAACSQPLCPDCQNDPKTMEHMGISVQ